MKKGQIVEGIIERVDFPNKGILRAEDGTRVIVKNAIIPKYPMIICRK